MGSEKSTEEPAKIATRVEASGDSVELEIVDPKAGVFKLSKMRWVVLTGICIFGIFNGIVNEMGSILSIILDMMGLKLDQYFYLSQMFFYVMPTTAIPIAWTLDHFGLKKFMYACLALLALRNGCRALLFYPESYYWPQLHFVYWFVAGIVSIQLIMAYYSLPLKVAENWFPKEERSLAWALMDLSMSLGIAIMGLALPHVVTDTAHVHPITFLNITAFLVSSVAIVVCVRKSVPEHPPSVRRIKASHADGQSAWQNIRNLVRNRNLFIQVCVTNSLNSFFYLIINILQDILKASDLSKVFAGQFAACITVVGSATQLGGAFVMGRWARESDSEETNIRKCKLFLSAQCLAFIAYMLALSLRDSPHQWWIALGAAIMYTALRGLAAPVFANMSAQLMAGSITEASVSAASSIIFCILNSIYSLVFVYLRGEDENGRAYYSYSLLFASLSILSATFNYVTFVSAKSRAITTDAWEQPIQPFTIQDEDHEANAI